MYQTIKEIYDVLKLEELLNVLIYTRTISHATAVRFAIHHGFNIDGLFEYRVQTLLDIYRNIEYF